MVLCYSFKTLLLNKFYFFIQYWTKLSFLLEASPEVVWLVKGFKISPPGGFLLVQYYSPPLGTCVYSFCVCICVFVCDSLCVCKCICVCICNIMYVCLNNKCVCKCMCVYKCRCDCMCVCMLEEHFLKSKNFNWKYVVWFRWILTTLYSYEFVPTCYLNFFLLDVIKNKVACQNFLMTAFLIFYGAKNIYKLNYQFLRKT